MNDLAERRMTFSDLCKMLCEEHCVDVGLFKNFSVPQEVLDAQNGGQGIAFSNPNSFPLLHLQLFAIALSVYFSIIGRKLEHSDGRTIRWDGGSVRLGKKPYKFVQALYLAKKKRMKIAGIAKAVWGNELESHATIKVTAGNLVRELEKEKFPYKIVSVKHKKRIVKYEDKRTANKLIECFAVHICIL